jgi:hypothetical protein
MVILISYDASGNPVAVATGTDGQVLTVLLVLVHLQLLKLYQLTLQLFRCLKVLINVTANTYDKSVL